MEEKISARKRLKNLWSRDGAVTVPRGVLLAGLLSVVVAACGDSGVLPEDFAEVLPDPDDGLWEAGPDIPWPVPAQSGVAFDSAAFVVGRVFITGIPTGVVLRLDKTDRWEILPFIDFPGARFDAVVLADTLYVLGRNDLEMALFAWNSSELSWSLRPAPSGGRSSAPVALDDRLFLIGGSQETATYVYAPESATWTEAAPPRTPRSDPIAFAVDDQIYLFGVPVEGEALLEVMDVHNNTWASLGPTPITHTRLLTSRLGDRLHFFGGFAKGSTSRAVQHLAFDLIDLSWDTLPDIPTPRADGAGFAHRGGVYLVAGETLVFDLGPEQPLLTVDKYSEPN